MKKLVWFAAAILAVSFLFPNGVEPFLPKPTPAPAPAPEPAPHPVVVPDAAIVRLLASAEAADKQRIASVYRGMRAVLERDAGQRVTTTEKFADFHANTLQLALNYKPGKYPGLDVEIDRVFKAAVGDDVVSVRGETLDNLLKACDVVIVSAK